MKICVFNGDDTEADDANICGISESGTEADVKIYAFNAAGSEADVKPAVFPQPVQLLAYKDKGTITSES